MVASFNYEGTELPVSENGYHKTETKNKMSINVFVTVCYYHVTYEFQSESTLYSC